MCACEIVVFLLKTSVASCSFLSFYLSNFNVMTLQAVGQGVVQQLTKQGYTLQQTLSFSPILLPNGQYIDGRFNILNFLLLPHSSLSLPPTQMFLYFYHAKGSNASPTGTIAQVTAKTPCTAMSVETRRSLWVSLAVKIIIGHTSHNFPFPLRIQCTDDKDVHVLVGANHNATGKALYSNVAVYVGADVRKTNNHYPQPIIIYQY